jgi:hypothetical protein
MLATNRGDSPPSAKPSPFEEDGYEDELVINSRINTSLENVELESFSK